MITTYEALTMGQYQDIDRITRGEGDELDKQVAVLSILTGKDEGELLRLPLAEYTDIAARSAFLRRPIERTPAVRDTYRLGEWVLRPVKDYRRLTAGQYIDFQAFTRDTLDYCGLLSVLMVPEGRKYGDGYDPLEVRDVIAGTLPMPDGMALIAFFLNRYAALISASLTYSERAIGKIRDRKKQETMAARITQARELLRLAGAGLRTSRR